jgi:hypothetical protein
MTAAVPPAPDAAPEPKRSPSALLWGALFMIAMFGAGIGARLVNLNGFWSMVVMLPPMLLLIPYLRTYEARAAAQGCVSPALIRYNRRQLIWAFVYVAALFIAITAQDRLDPNGALLWAVAMLPALPIFYFVYSLRAYLREEDDEYLKMRFVDQALWGLGGLMVIATFWGFLESFGAVPHAAGWLALPIWAIGMGAAGIIQKWRGA